MTSRIRVLLLAALLLLAGCNLSNAAVPATDPPLPSQQPEAPAATLGETYVNPDFGYAFDYPDEWFLISSQGDVVILQSFEPQEAGRGGIDPAETKIDFYPLDAAGTLEAVAAEQRDSLAEVNAEIVSQEMITLPSGLRALRSEISGGMGGGIAYLVADDEGVFLTVSVYGNAAPSNDIIQTIRRTRPAT